MVAGITAARRGLKVCLLEHKNEVGKKILCTGNGKCNLTHAGVCSKDYPDEYGEITAKVFDYFGYEKTIDFFKSIGIFTVEKNDYVYPMSGTALSVRNALSDELKRLKADVFIGADVKRITPGFCVDATVEGKNICFEGKTVIVAAGSCASPVTGSDGSGYRLLEDIGVKIKKPLPALVKFISDDRSCKRASGVRADCSIKLYVNGELKAGDKGELQFTDDGISGIPVFQISRYATLALDEGDEVEVEIDAAPGMTSEELDEYFSYGRKNAEDRSLKNFLGGIMPSKLVSAIADKASISYDKKIRDIGEEKVIEIIQSIKEYRLKIIKTNGFDGAQVCRGGVNLSEINFDTMEHQRIKGLFFAGEIIDIDGPCGGYNLQWAWSSGAVAGMNV